MRQKKTKAAFTLVELLVVMAIISFLMAVLVPALHVAREHGRETVCRSQLRQMSMALKTYTQDNDSRFPEASKTYAPDNETRVPGGRTLYHSAVSVSAPWAGRFRECCRWHDARIGFDSPLLRTEHPELRGSLWPYLGNHKIVRCPVGARANRLRGCHNQMHDPNIPIVPQYTYSMNCHLGGGLNTGTSATGSVRDKLDPRTLRSTEVRKETQVTRAAAEVFAFGEENSWAVNLWGQQPLDIRPEWAASYNLSGAYPGHDGTLRTPHLDILPTYEVELPLGALSRYENRFGDAFATCHRPRGGDLNTGHSYVVMLDGHVEKVTVSDQLRRSRRPADMGECRLGPGGNLARAWPLEIPPPGGWENQ
jgi:prepilin-type N-terminal cleavage/methylation domain-containing protein